MGRTLRGSSLWRWFLSLTPLGELHIYPYSLVSLVCIEPNVIGIVQHWQSERIEKAPPAKKKKNKKIQSDSSSIQCAYGGGWDRELHVRVYWRVDEWGAYDDGKAASGFPSYIIHTLKFHSDFYLFFFFLSDNFLIVFYGSGDYMGYSVA